VRSAFDGDPSTSWLTGYYSKLLSKNSVKVIFNQAEPVKSIILVDALGKDLRRTEQVGVTLLDGSYFKAKFIQGKSVVTLPEKRKITGFILTFESVKNKGNAPFGLSEVIVRRVNGSNVDLSQEERLPVDVADVVESHPNLLPALAGVDFQFAMERTRTSKDNGDSSFARTFKVPAQRVFLCRAELML